MAPQIVDKLFCEVRDIKDIIRLPNFIPPRIITERHDSRIFQTTQFGEPRRPECIGLRIGPSTFCRPAETMNENDVERSRSRVVWRLNKRSEADLARLGGCGLFVPRSRFHSLPRQFEGLLCMVSSVRNRRRAIPSLEWGILVFVRYRYSTSNLCAGVGRRIAAVVHTYLLVLHKMAHSSNGWTAAFSLAHGNIRQIATQGKTKQTQTHLVHPRLVRPIPIHEHSAIQIPKISLFIGWRTWNLRNSVKDTTFVIYLFSTSIWRPTYSLTRHLVGHRLVRLSCYYWLWRTLCLLLSDWTINPSRIRTRSPETSDEIIEMSPLLSTPANIVGNIRYPQSPQNLNSSGQANVWLILFTILMLRTYSGLQTSKVQKFLIHLTFKFGHFFCTRVSLLNNKQRTQSKWMKPNRVSTASKHNMTFTWIFTHYALQPRCRQLCSTQLGQNRRSFGFLLSIPTFHSTRTQQVFNFNE